MSSGQISPVRENTPEAGEAMAGVEFPTEKRVVVDTNQLDPAMRAMVLEYRPDMYMSPFFAGNDEAPGRPEYLRKRAKMPCVVAFRQEVTVDDHIQYPATFVGPSINVRSEAATAPGRGKGRGRGKANAAVNPAPSSTAKAKDIIKIGFHTDSQTPNIEITTRRDGTAESGSDGLISLRIYAQDILLDRQSGHAMVHMRPVEEEFDEKHFNQRDGAPGNADIVELAQMTSHTQLFEVQIVLKKPGEAGDQWTGMPAFEINDICSRPAQKDTMTRDLLVKNFFAGGIISFFIRCRDRAGIIELQNYVDYLRRVMTVSARCGNFWYYRRITHLRGLGINAIEAPKLPKCNLGAPRWMVTKWQFVETTTNGYRNKDEAAFLLKMGIEAEQRRQTRALLELAQSKYELHLRASFKEVPDMSGSYIAQIYLPNSTITTERALKMPGTGTKIQIQIDPTNPWEASKHTAKKFKGSVVADLFNDGAAFVCQLHGPHKVFGENCLSFGETYPVYIGYLIDTIPYQRQMKSVEQLQAINPLMKPMGVDALALFFNESTPAPMPNQLAIDLVPKLPAFQEYVDSQPRATKPNEKQKKAILDTAQSSSGLTLLQGPPGTGKTDTLRLIINGLARQGIKCLCTAPQNEAVINLYEAYEKSNDHLVDDEYVHFTGATVNMDAAEKLQLRQELMANHPAIQADEADFMVNADNLMVQYARMMVGQHGSDIAWTFGRKLNTVASAWASSIDPDHAVQIDYANDYFKLQDDLQYVSKREERTDIIERIEILEWNLGYFYLRDVVNVVFCTLSASAHPLLVAAFNFQELVVDESAHESIGGLATVFGAHKDKIQHVTLAGDHKQGTSVYAAKDSNAGHRMLSRKLFEEVFTDPRQLHTVAKLNESYRMLPKLLEFVAQFYNNELKAFRNCHEMDQELQLSLTAFWKAHLRHSFTGSPFQVAIDASAEGFGHSQLQGTTTKSNDTEAMIIADVIKRMLEFDPPAGGRKIAYDDLGVVTPYTGQVIAIKAMLRGHGLDSSRMLVSSTNHVQGKQRKVIFFSVVVNTGSLRPLHNDHVPIKFVAEPHNINVSLSRQRIGRYIVGGLQCLVQMAEDRHQQATRFPAFFNLLKKLNRDDCIVSTAEWTHVMDNDGKSPDTLELTSARVFNRLIKSGLPASAPGSLPDAPPTQLGNFANPFNFQGISKTTSQNAGPEPPNVDFPPNAQGNGKRSSKKQKTDKPSGGGHRERGGRGGGRGGRGGDRGGRGGAVLSAS